MSERALIKLNNCYSENNIAQEVENHRHSGDYQHRDGFVKFLEQSPYILDERFDQNICRSLNGTIFDSPKTLSPLQTERTIKINVPDFLEDNEALNDFLETKQMNNLEKANKEVVVQPLIQESQPTTPNMMNMDKNEIKYTDLFANIDFAQIHLEKMKKKLIDTMQIKILKLEQDLRKYQKINQDLESQNKKLNIQITGFIAEKEAFTHTVDQYEKKIKRLQEHCLKNEEVLSGLKNILSFQDEEIQTKIKTRIESELNKQYYREKHLDRKVHIALNDETEVLEKAQVKSPTAHLKKSSGSISKKLDEYKDKSLKK